jgi:hypothetical protein
MNAPFMVRVHHTNVQFCWSGVTGMIAARSGCAGLAMAVT